MAFVILSGGDLAASRVRTVTTRLLGVVVCVLFALALGGGLAGGFALGSRLATSGDPAPVAIVEPGQPASEALIDRIGALSARLALLEGNARNLAQRLGIQEQPAPLAESLPAAGSGEPSGGPLVAPLIGQSPGGLPDLEAGIAHLENGIEEVGERLALVTRHTAQDDIAGMAIPSRMPIAGARVSSRFGNRRDPFTRRLARHTGVDLPAAHGTPILASAGGKVRFAGYHSAYGNLVEIDHGGGLVTRYAHASKLMVRRGQVVLPEQPIAAVGSTGRSTGPHLHFEVIRNGAYVEPLGLLKRSAQ